MHGFPAAFRASLRAALGLAAALAASRVALADTVLITGANSGIGLEFVTLEDSGRFLQYDGAAEPW